MLASAATLLLLHATPSHAQYVRTQVDGGAPAADHCVHWPQGTLTFNQNAQGQPGLADAKAGITKALQTWETKLNSCANLKLVEGAETSSRTVGYDQSSTSNQNLILFREKQCSQVAPPGDPCFNDGTCGNKYDCWGYGNVSDTIALTTVTFVLTTGQLVDADMELNNAAACFQTDASPNGSCFDVQDTATHEFGHALGLAHSPDRSSVMYPTTNPGVTSKRVLDMDSAQFVCDVYPSGLASRDCVIDATLGDIGKAAGGGCSSSAPSLTAFAALLSALFLARRGRA